ncbi:MAG TPA: RluA family pseudouridine synthase [Tepidisphaeraceae bacterium]
MSESQSFRVPADQSSARLDIFLTKHLQISRSDAKQLIADGKVYINGSSIRKKGSILQGGENIEIVDLAAHISNQLIPRPDLPLLELNRGKGWVAVDKPPGQPVHPLKPGESETLLNAVVARYPEIQGIGEGGLRSGVVHRLDIDTSGVILFATEQYRWQTLRRAFEEHTAQKIYHAIVAGHVRDSARLVLDLRIAQHSPARVKVVDERIVPKPPGTRRCDLSYRPMAFSSSLGAPGEGLGCAATLLEIQLGTGFLHQIRVMLAHICHPVLGDATYGQSDPTIPRQMLHARSIRIGDIHAESHAPADFARSLSLLRLDH